MNAQIYPFSLQKEGFIASPPPWTGFTDGLFWLEVSTVKIKRLAQEHNNDRVRIQAPTIRSEAFRVNWHSS